jgi:hypothetical protein
MPTNMEELEDLEAPMDVADAGDGDIEVSNPLLLALLLLLCDFLLVKMFHSSKIGRKMRHNQPPHCPISSSSHLI